MDAAIDATPSKWVVIETILVPAVGAVMTSTKVLESGVTYRLRALGTYQWDGANSVADAEYIVLTDTAYDVRGIDYGLAIDEPAPVAMRAFRWGSAYNATHIYEGMWIGKGAPITAKIVSPVAPGNTGILVLEIMAFQ